MKMKMKMKIERIQEYHDWEELSTFNRCYESENNMRSAKDKQYISIFNSNSKRNQIIKNWTNEKYS